MATKKPPTIPLPRSWTKHVRSAMLNVVSLAQYATVYTRIWAVDSRNGRVRFGHHIDIVEPGLADSYWRARRCAHE